MWWIVAIATAAKAALAAWLAGLITRAAGVSRSIDWSVVPDSRSGDGPEPLRALVGVLLLGCLGALFGLLTSTVQRRWLATRPPHWILVSAITTAVVAGLGGLVIAIANRLFRDLARDPGLTIEFVVLAMCEGVALALVQRQLLRTRPT